LNCDEANATFSTFQSQPMTKSTAQKISVLRQEPTLSAAEQKMLKGGICDKRRRTTVQATNTGKYSIVVNFGD